ncbi:MAG: 4-(cytidine 5'-diphospho)-2-C-methyl-D-erythritol kinase [Pseudooceanicola sp.]|nr:4-(cytidine 5'-diphospho)-2-C-methyl-D-erythritol kinase [Pseudooceanicola sp.]
MSATTEFAPAKINLTLHVTGRRDDGYHLLDSLVVFARVGDALTIAEAPEMALTVTGRFRDGVPEDARNLVWKAADAAGRRLAITLDKALPHGAGIGGGSADAAAVLRYCGAGALAAGIGADVPVCLSNMPQRMQDIGATLTPAARVPALNIVLVHPGVHVPTPQVFAALISRENPDMGVLPGWDDAQAFTEWLGDGRNDMQEAAISIAPDIGAVLDALGDADLARMSGSGSACFGIYPGPEAAAAAARRIQAAHPDWWAVATQTMAA